MEPAAATRRILTPQHRAPPFPYSLASRKIVDVANNSYTAWNGNAAGEARVNGATGHSAMSRSQGGDSEQPPEFMFELADAEKRFGSFTALSPVSLAIRQGERVALMGPSGSGKTTLLRMLAALHTPDAGVCRIGGKPIGELRPGLELSRLVGIMPQSLDLVLSLAVVHNVAAGRLGEWSFWRALWSLFSPRELNRVQEALARVGLLEKLYERTSTLSGGQQQRVALARLLVQSPRAILVDEPVASVDPARAEDLIALVNELATENGQTLVASLHSVPLAMNYFSRIIALRPGRIVFDLPAEEVTDEDLNALYSFEEVPTWRAADSSRSYHQEAQP